MTSSCTGPDEYDFTACIGNTTGVTNGSITCTDLGGTFRFDSLLHSAIRGSKPASVSSGGGGGGSSITRIYACENNMDDDGDGLVDLADPGCEKAKDDSEFNCQEDWHCTAWTPCEDNNPKWGAKWGMGSNTAFAARRNALAKIGGK